MKKSKLLTIGLVAVFATTSFHVNQVKANTPPKRVAGAGVGVVVVAAIIIAGLVYYIVEKNGERLIVDENGNTPYRKYQEFLEPGEWVDPIYVDKDAITAYSEWQCQKYARDYGLKLLDSIKKVRNGEIIYICVFEKGK